MSARERLASDFKAWMEVAVALLDRPLEARAEILARWDLDDRDFDAIDAAWSRAMMTELVRGDTSKAEAYGRRCKEELERRATEDRDCESTLPVEALGEIPPRALPFNESKRAVQCEDAARPRVALGDGSDGDTVELELTKLGRPVTPFDKRGG